MADNTVLTTPSTEAINNPLVTPGDKGEPAHEWASSTLEALSPAASKAKLDEESYTSANESANAGFHDSSSTATTPGVAVPGAFPRELEAESKASTHSISEDAQYVKEVASSYLETAKGYVMTTTEQVGSKVGELLHDNVAPYLPASLHPPHSEVKGSASPSTENAPKPDDVTLEGVPTPASAPPPEEPSHEAKSETMREGNPGSVLSGSARGDGASADASVRSLAGSRSADRKSTNTVTESDSYSFTAAPNVAEFPQLEADHMKRPEESSKSDNAVTEQDRPNLEHHAAETQHIPPVAPPAPDASDDTKLSAAPGSPVPGRTIPNTTARDYPVGTVDAQNVGFTHKDSEWSTMATPGHGDVNSATAAAAAMPPTVSESPTAQGEEGDQSYDDGLTRAENHAVTASSGITAADLAETGAAPAMAGAGPTTAVSDPTPPAPPAKDEETSQAKGASISSSTAKPTTDVSHKADVPSEPAAGKAPSPSSQSKAGAGKTKSGFMDKLKGEMKVLTGKLEHKSEKVEEGKKMMGKN